MLSPEHCWQAIENRSKASDGAFVYGVVTTGVYCRPSCASKQPLRENVRFFALAAQAEAEGFRPCKRCAPRDATPVDARARLVQQACDAIRAGLDSDSACNLKALSAQLGYTPQHIQRTFKAVLGITPREYAETLRLNQFKRALRRESTVTDAVYAAGYGSSSRVYERAQNHMGMTPADYRSGGIGVEIAFACVESRYGVLLAAMTPRGVCAVGFYDDEAGAESALRDEYPHADIQRDDSRLAPILRDVLAHIDGALPALTLPLDVQATAFQRRVWQALCEIPRGETRTYAQVAQAIGQPSAVRAVAAACGSNRAAIVIPCHRVIGANGKLTGYKWGITRKQKLLEAEAASGQD